MHNIIHILHLEDNPRDAEIIQAKLEAGGIAHDILRVDNEEDFKRALNTSTFDLILSDYNLPGYDGVSALQWAREKFPLTPVMLISGSMGEEAAVQCLQHGAVDYVLKQRLDRLCVAVKRALDEADEHRRRVEVEAALRESEERFRNLAENSHEVFWFLSLSPERVLYISPAVERIWGLPAERFYQDTSLWAEATHPEDRQSVRAVWESCLKNSLSRFEIEYRIVRPDGTIRWVLNSGTPVCNERREVVRFGGVARDITERKMVERQTLRVQRMESLGTLAGGIAHDLNNALAPILMSVSLLRHRHPEEHEILDTVESSTLRGAGMVRQLLTFAKGIEGERMLLQPFHLFQEMKKIITGTFPKNLTLRVVCEAVLPMVLGDSTQLHQVLLNLCVNARDAMPNGGTLTLKAEVLDIDAAYAGAVPESKVGSYVVLHVTDNGTGMPAGLMDRIFEPFFSTKGPDNGTGLGLSTTLGIVRSHEGFIRVHSVLHQGSTFSIYLPATGPNAGSEPPEKPTVEFSGHGETILVVDDEPAFRSITRELLSSLNFKVMTASEGTEALVRVAEHRAELSAMITDMHMPYMDGLSLVRAVRRMLPGVHIIVATGRLEARDNDELKGLGISATLEKPFSLEQLVEVLKTIFKE